MGPQDTWDLGQASTWAATDKTQGGDQEELLCLLLPGKELPSPTMSNPSEPAMTAAGSRGLDLNPGWPFHPKQAGGHLSHPQGSLSLEPKWAFWTDVKAV